MSNSTLLHSPDDALSHSLDDAVPTKALITVILIALSVSWFTNTFFRKASAFSLLFSRVIEADTSVELPLPPGPRSKFLFGNAFDLPLTDQSEVFTRWAKEFGDLTYLNVLGTPMVVTSSMDVARDLLEKRSAIYSSRPIFRMLNELVQMSWNFVFMEYGKKWRAHRRVFHEVFHSERVATFGEIQVKHIKAMLKIFPTSNEQIGVHIKRYTSALLLESVYGIEVLSSHEKDPFIFLTTNGMKAVDAAITPGAFYVEPFPMLRYVPGWVPGANFQHIALRWKKITTDLLFKPFIRAKETTEEYNSDSFMAAWLDRLKANGNKETEHSEEVVRNVAAAALLAGTETTADTLHKFVLAMILFPRVQRKAQEELDRVLGRGRLPTLDDEQDLPYIAAVIKEVLRWNVISPIGFAHRAIKEDIYRGYQIPKDTLVIVNVRNIMYNEELFGPNCDEFRPERFIDYKCADTKIAFGFGRRVCPGRHLAYQSLFLLASHMLHVYDIGKRLDTDGKEIPVLEEFTTTMEW
ncbi:putative CyP450 monooxygenase [Collybia nuda]|uniref:CyP450 monooxygenase n=1 Tax=Collybia nuda TaxID=64659 RepID=A0A9P6CQK2_9AGAR|nr:putative CyP450 monooxygenase [Collybia nuda]